jgi:hypothetical protein
MIDHSWLTEVLAGKEISLQEIANGSNLLLQVVVFC